MDANDRAHDRSTSSLNDPMPGTAAADASQASLRDSAVTSRHAGDASDASDARHADANPGDEIGEAVGGISGVLTGAALGSLGGPIGTVIGGIAGAVSGWWAGRAISEAASHATDDDDAYYRGEYERAIEQRVQRGADTGAEDSARATLSGASAATSSTADVPPAPARGYDHVRPAYQLGHLAGRNPDYHGRSFDDVEADLRHGWTDDVSRQHGAWDEVRGHVRAAYDRSQANYVGSGGSAGSQVSSGMSALAAGATYAAGRTGFGDGRPAGDAAHGGDPTDRRP